MTELPRSPFSRWARRLARASVLGLLAVLVAFGALALALDGTSRLLAAAFVLASVALLTGRAARRTRRLVWCALVLLLALWWARLEPRNDRDWQPDVARLAGARVEGERITFSGVRDFDWSEAEAGHERWGETSFALADVRGVDLVLCDWGAPGIVHTILSFALADGTHLAFSVETRKERGESYSAVRGFFRQYELYYAVASERDLLGVRAAFRGERLRLYPLVMRPEVAQELLLAYAQRLEQLAQRPAWYHAVSASCTSSIRRHVLELGLVSPWDWRLLANAHVDELLHEHGRIASPLPLTELRARHDVTEAARAALAGPPEEFSMRLRRELPPPAPGG